MSGLIPYDEFMLGKALFVIEKKADFLSGAVDAGVIAAVSGQNATQIEQSLTMKNSVASGGAYVGGFETIPFAMRNTSASRDIAVAASVTLNNLMLSHAALQTLTFTDGANSVTVYSESTAMLETNTFITSVIGGVTTTKTLCVNHNFSGICQKYYCPTLRIDKGLGQVLFYVDDGLYGVVDVEGLENFGLSKFVYKFSGATQSAVTAWVRQVVLRLEC